MMTLLTAAVLFLMGLIMASSSPPITMVILLLTCTTLCFMSSWVLTSPWFSFILFIIFVGALMVLFAYISSLASNEGMDIKINLQMLVITSTVMCAPAFYLIKSSMTAPMISNIMVVEKIYFEPLISLILVTMVFLLITMFVAAALGLPTKAPLRSLLQLI